MGCLSSHEAHESQEAPVNSTGERLTVIVVHYNPQQFKRRAEVVNQCLQRLADTRQRIQNSSVSLNIIGVELIYGERSSEITMIDGVNLVQRYVPEKQVMWSKEQLVNLAIRSLRADEKYVAWIDSDVEFVDDSWVKMTIDKLSEEPLAFAQLWTTCDMLGRDGNKKKGMTFNSFTAQKEKGKSYISVSNRKVDDYWHPGFAWAATMEALKRTDYLIDKTLGSADRHMAMAFLERAAETVPENMDQTYRNQVMDWQQKVVDNKIALKVVPTHIKHHWHGKLKNRQYMRRWDLLTKHKFNPTKHLKWNKGTGLYDWDDDCPLDLLEEIMEYFGNRQEDSSDSSDSDSSHSHSSHSLHNEEGNDNIINVNECDEQGENDGDGGDDGGCSEHNDEGNNEIGNAMDFYG